MNIILTGLRGTGKSSLGRIVSHKMQFGFLDTDTFIEEQAGARISDIVHEHGWEYFRTLERQVVERVANQDRYIIATGGGTLMDPENTRRLKQHGIVILLLCDLAVLQRRLTLGSNRPSLTGQGSAATELGHIWTERRARYYAVADLTYDVSPESSNMLEDLEHKAQALVTLVQQDPRFHSA
ncbi:MAG: shikimate kinase [Candidatus Tectimicrobiota bacterium]